MCPSATAPQSGLQAKIGLGSVCPGTSPFSSPNFLSSLSPFYKKRLAPPSPSPLTSLLSSAFVKFCFHCIFSLIPSSPSPWPQPWPYPLPQTLGPAPPWPPASPLQSPQRGLSNPEVTQPSPVTAPPQHPSLSACCGGGTSVTGLDTMQLLDPRYLSGPQAFTHGSLPFLLVLQVIAATSPPRARGSAWLRWAQAPTPTQSLP